MRGRLRPRAARFVRRPSVAAAPSRRSRCRCRRAAWSRPSRSSPAARATTSRASPRRRATSARRPRAVRGGHAGLGQQHRTRPAHARRAARRQLSVSRRATSCSGAPSSTANRHTRCTFTNSRPPSSRSARFRAVTCATAREAACSWAWGRGVGRAGPAVDPAHYGGVGTRRRRVRHDPARVALNGRACHRSSAAPAAFFL